MTRQTSQSEAAYAEMMKQHEETMAGMNEWKERTHADPFADEEPLLYGDADKIALGRHALGRAIAIEQNHALIETVLDDFDALRPNYGANVRGIGLAGKRTEEQPSGGLSVHRDYNVGSNYAGYGASTPGKITITTNQIAPLTQLIGGSRTAEQLLEDELEFRAAEKLTLFFEKIILQFAARAVRNNLGKTNLGTYTESIKQATIANATSVMSAVQKFTEQAFAGQTNKLSHVHEKAVHELTKLADDTLDNLSKI